MLRLLLLVFLVGCGSFELPDDFLPTFTPENAVPTPTAQNTATALPVATDTQQPVPATSTSTPEAVSPWKYVLLQDFLIRCVAVDEQGNAIECRIREEPNLNADYRLVPNGTELQATALSHCEFYVSCDSFVVEWYYLTTGEWAAALDYVWQSVTPTED